MLIQFFELFERQQKRRLQIGAVPSARNGTAQQGDAADASGLRCDFMSCEEMLMCQATKQGTSAACAAASATSSARTPSSAT
jgi:hypothetical protein